MTPRVASYQERQYLHEGRLLDEAIVSENARKDPGSDDLLSPTRLCQLLFANASRILSSRSPTTLRMP